MHDLKTILLSTSSEYSLMYYCSSGFNSVFSFSFTYARFEFLIEYFDYDISIVILLVYGSPVSWLCLSILIMIMNRKFNGIFFSINEALNEDVILLVHIFNFIIWDFYYLITCNEYFLEH